MELQQTSYLSSWFLIVMESFGKKCHLPCLWGNLKHTQMSKHILVVLITFWINLLESRIIGSHLGAHILCFREKKSSLIQDSRQLSSILSIFSGNSSNASEFTFYFLPLQIDRANAWYKWTLNYFEKAALTPTVFSQLTINTVKEYQFYCSEILRMISKVS